MNGPDPTAPESTFPSGAENAPAFPTDDNKRHAERLEETLFEVKRVIVGQDRMVERAMICLLARGHCLIEGVPGLAKTLTVSTLAQVSRRHLRAPPVHARPRAGRHRRHAGVAPLA